MEPINAVLEQIYRNLEAGKLLHLATRSNGVLWMCHVWYATEKDAPLLYFTSNKNRRHSHEIRSNSVVTGGIVPITLEGLGQKVIGISFEGAAEEAMGDAARRAYDVYAEKWPNVKSMFSYKDIEIGYTDMRMYKVTIGRIVLFDEVNFPDSPRQEIVMPGLS